MPFAASWAALRGIRADLGRGVGVGVRADLGRGVGVRREAAREAAPDGGRVFRDAVGFSGIRSGVAA